MNVSWCLMRKYVCSGCSNMPSWSVVFGQKINHDDEGFSGCPQTANNGAMMHIGKSGTRAGISLVAFQS
ncbi:hypothetical protein SLEP1_g57336 [Rubroshorea leprosula]|uniref:Uncharacterized protein n=1 Tax=Rubroshorea leprosula TaxID=152421 RepID=A0AAV5ML51_9ROSI|nr:hypothetical protein SLEP1_g57336 [Rubroshorea leprosula]